MEYRVIGYVHRLEEGDSSWDRPERMEIRIDPAYAPGLRGIEEFSHLYVIFHFDRRPADGVELTVRPEHRADMPELGVFATCSPTRPSPLGMTLVELLAVEGDRLLVTGLDAWDGTPVIDIKPFMEAPEQYRIPDWLVRLWEGDGV